MLEWMTIRDEVTCEVYYKLWDENLLRYVVEIHNDHNAYRVQILDHAPFRVKKLRLAKSASQHIYEQIGVYNGTS